jgi:heme exporter protein A
MTKFSGTELTCIRGERVVFTDLNFSINDGEILNLRGPNGSGKSTLLRLMSSLLKPTHGTITWDNINIIDDESSFKTLIHYIGHQDAIKTGLTVEENLRFWAETKSSKNGTTKLSEALEQFSLEKFSELPGRLLSAGQRKRLNLARMCATWAPLWLLDEPSNSLDAQSLAELYNAISVHQKKGGMIVIATHEKINLDSVKLDISEFTAANISRGEHNAR